MKWLDDSCINGAEDLYNQPREHEKHMFDLKAHMAMTARAKELRNRGVVYRPSGEIEIPCPYTGRLHLRFEWHPCCPSRLTFDNFSSGECGATTAVDVIRALDCYEANDRAEHHRQWNIARMRVFRSYMSGDIHASELFGNKRRRAGSHHPAVWVA